MKFREIIKPGHVKYFLSLWRPFLFLFLFLIFIFCRTKALCVLSGFAIVNNIARKKNVILAEK